jgi:hypothetical protein
VCLREAAKIIKTHHIFVLAFDMHECNIVVRLERLINLPSKQTTFYKSKKLAHSKLCQEHIYTIYICLFFCRPLKCSNWYAISSLCDYLLPIFLNIILMFSVCFLPELKI